MRIWRALMAAALATALLAACGDDDTTDDAAPAETTDAADPAEPGEPGEAPDGDEPADPDAPVELSPDAERYCEITRELDDLSDDAVDIEWETATEEEFGAALQQFVSQPEVASRIGELASVAPDQIRDEVVVLVDAIRHIGETGDTSVFEDPDYQAAEDAVTTWEFENCEDRTTG